ncbi:hypothetical protein AC579_4849 [Pseudocercospora musae]|uniref:Rhodopsin domain-containing protein n=1 Tax=Pseudocercospora musae TaxID=113226 RepID=A0A139IKU6_9PEZI|nr:hypothetical protein AC579_4849 [Pseudocercospora musae]
MTTLESRATLGVAIAFFVLSWISVGLRILVRASMLRNFGADDWTMLATQLLFSAYLTAQLVGVAYGTGQHLDDLVPWRAERALKAWYFCEIFYVCSTSFLKVSIGLFLLRVATNKIHIWIVRMIMMLAAVFGFAFLFVIIFQCWPISDWWSLDPTQKHCIKPDIVIGLTYGVSGLNVIADWTLGILPAFIVKDLQILAQSFDGSNGDFLYTTVGVAIWTTVEIGIGVTAGCMATLRPLIRLAFDKLGLSSSSGVRKSSGFRVPQYSRGRATPLDDFVILSPKHGKTVTTITGNFDEEERSRSSSQEGFSRPHIQDMHAITKHFVVEYDDAKPDHEYEQGFTSLPKRS